MVVDGPDLSCKCINPHIQKSLNIQLLVIGGFKGEAGEALPPQIFLTLKFVVCIALKIIEIVAT